MQLFAFTEPLKDINGNVPGQTGKPAAKLAAKKKATKGDSRDSIYMHNSMKYRKGLMLNPEYVSGEGSAAVFQLPFSSPGDTAASPLLKKVLAYLGIIDLSGLVINIDDMSRVPKSVVVSYCSSTLQLSW